MIGTSLSYAKLNNGEYVNLLPKLVDLGVKSIELRSVLGSSSSQDVLRGGKHFME